MTQVRKTPGVHFTELDAFSNSVVEVATAIPAFIGHTSVAGSQDEPLLNKALRVNSLLEYEKYFGLGPKPLFSIVEKKDSAVQADLQVNGRDYLLEQASGAAGGRYLLYNALRHFFQNGGGSCYIVSVGDYNQDLDLSKFKAGLDALQNEPEPTMVVVPDAVLFKQPDCISLQQAMLAHCGETMRSRVAILDLWGGDRDRQDPAGDPITLFRDSLGVNHLDFGTAYYPWLNSTVTGLNELSEQNLGSASIALLPRLLNGAPSEGSGLLNDILGAMQRKLNVLPPSAAMAGVYTRVDSTSGVWEAPANVSLSGVLSATVSISDEQQEDLNVSADGKSINAIRSFSGEGVMVWGARTLDGNSVDWRYINARRTAIMIEQSCQLALRAYVFEPNAASTWTAVASMIGNFLTGIWSNGGLAGRTAAEAFSVQVGLGTTMTGQDVLDGYLRVVMKVAIQRPAEFIAIGIEQQMQKS